MPLITVDLASIPKPARDRIRKTWFPLLKSETITNPSDVNNMSIKNYLDSLVNMRVKNEEIKEHTKTFAFIKPAL